MQSAACGNARATGRPRRHGAARPPGNQGKPDTDRPGRKTVDRCARHGAHADPPSSKTCPAERDPRMHPGQTGEMPAPAGWAAARPCHRKAILLWVLHNPPGLDN